MVKWLLEHGATNINIPDFNNKTPLQVAVELGHTEIAEVLRQHGGRE
jgi:ankyrin repeat protein